jgi:hypothetical protein
MHRWSPGLLTITKHGWSGRSPVAARGHGSCSEPPATKPSCQWCGQALARRCCLGSPSTDPTPGPTTSSASTNCDHRPSARGRCAGRPDAPNRRSWAEPSTSPSKPPKSWPARCDIGEVPICWLWQPPEWECLWLLFWRPSWLHGLDGGRWAPGPTGIWQTARRARHYRRTRRAA